ncbi:MAG: OmpA family protein [Planctomycetes bacterium]|nr:OmpA family protein [Planctomycetota bacterium]
MLIATFRHSEAVFALWLLTLLAAGCNRYAYAPSPPAAAVMPQQQPAIVQQTQQHQQQVADLDRNNQELQALLAQSRQQSQLLEDQTRATQLQLKDTTDRLASLQTETDQLRSRTTALTASMQTRAQAEIRANNSLTRNLTITSVPGVTVRPDGDVIRVELPADQLFNYGAPQLKYGADSLLRTVATEVMQVYSQQLIGIEGHTDGNPTLSPQYPTDQHMAVAQAMAVYDALTRAAGIPPQQLFVVGHGGSQPLVSNATEAGRARNRRVELVIYPETVRR